MLGASARRGVVSGTFRRSRTCWVGHNRRRAELSDRVLLVTQMLEPPRPGPHAAPAGLWGGAAGGRRRMGGALVGGRMRAEG